MPFLNILIFIATLTSPLYAMASGSSVRGGGNTVNHLLVEDYVIYPADLSHFDEVDKYLKVFGARVPEFEKKMRAIAYPAENDLGAVQWYYIPQKIQELPSSVTGLDFSTDQTAFQQDAEIFVSEADLRKLSREVQGRLYLHEILMMTRPDKDGGAVRKMMAFLKKKNYAPAAVELSSALAQLGFGAFPPRNDGAEFSYKQECGLDHAMGLDGRIKDCRPRPESMKTTTADVVWQLVTRRFDRSTGKYYEVWKDTHGDFLWGDSLENPYRYGEAIKYSASFQRKEQFACDSEDGKRANANISERTFHVPFQIEWDIAIKNGIQEIFPRSNRAYWTDDGASARDVEGIIQSAWAFVNSVTSNGSFQWLDVKSPLSVRCTSPAFSKRN